MLNVKLLEYAAITQNSTAAAYANIIAIGIVASLSL